MTGYQHIASAPAQESSRQGRKPARQTRTEHLAELLANRIVTGVLKPGQRLDEQLLAAEAGLSRTPVREALNRLAATGLVEIRPRRGAIVTCPDPARLRDGFELLAEIEAHGHANRVLHEMLYQGSHNSHLLEMATATHRRLSPFRSAQFEAARRLAISHEEHERVVAAVLRGDAREAAEAMRRHIGASGQSWEQFSAEATQARAG
ncbi:MAG: GntR family transcriptional regulator [Roseomonas mucosa]|nr:GntR family transcriptional regulator [Roseomonas mucosa]